MAGNGTPGPYEWMTYAEVITGSTDVPCLNCAAHMSQLVSCKQCSPCDVTAQAGKARTAIGSGLVHFGISPGSKVGLYSINCRGGCDLYGNVLSTVAAPLRTYLSLV